ncbi:MAG: flippase-like domain-containing protein, partial [Chloroflexi bacterium]|nr:flippase-like domain-containing protein [Chloroflexota bacterium]
MRRFLYALLLLLAVALVISRFAEFQQIINTFRLGAWYWIAFAAAVHAVYLVNVTAGYRAAFRIVGVEERLVNLIPLVIAANFVNVVTASGGIAGMAIFADDARRRGLSATRVTLGGVLFVLSDYAAFLCVLAIGFVILFRRNGLAAGELVAAGILVLAAAGLSLLLILGLRS